MTGIDKIINQIQLDTENTCNTIRATAQSRCEEIISEAEGTAVSMKSENEARAEQKYSDIISRANSLAELEAGKTMLSTKQSIIKEMISGVSAYINNMSNQEYFELLLRMIEKYSENSDGVICFSKNDTDRLPKDFELKINEVSKGKLTVSDEGINIKNGFVLVYGGIEVNCSFDALFYDKAEEISDTVSKILFS